MDKRLRFKELKEFVKVIIADYNKPNSIISKKEKRKTYVRYLKLLGMTIWNAILAPIFYPVWYLFRVQITNKVYKNSSWQDIVHLIDKNETSTAKAIVRSNSGSIFLYWLWTFGDLRDPLGIGELTDTGIKDTFLNRWWENGFRNPRFTINFIEFRTERITKFVTIIDQRDMNFMHKSTGIGDSPDGVYFKWAFSKDEKWWFIYENNNSMCLFYFGSVGMLKDKLGVSGRFETGYRQTEYSYWKM